jgi:AraC-like DNA-binding protein
MAPALGLNDNPTALGALQATAEQARPRDRCFLCAKLVSQMTDLAGQQFNSGSIRAGFGQINHPNQALNSSTPRGPTLSAAVMLTMNKPRRALTAGSARLHQNSLTEYGSEVARPCVEVVVRELIDRCDGSVRFSVKVVCAKLHLSQSQMAQKFKSRYHKTILEYWSEVRLNRARALLSESSARSVGSIATELGYQHATNFTNWFTRQMGISPRQYIANVRSSLFPASTLADQHVTPSSRLSCSQEKKELKSS